MHALIDFNKRSIKNGEGEIYALNTTFRDSTMIKLSIRKGRYTMDIVDSFGILALGLHDLCETYKTKTKKSILPYKFMTEKTLFYMGKKPSIEYCPPNSDELLKKHFNFEKSIDTKCYRFSIKRKS